MTTNRFDTPGSTPDPETLTPGDEHDAVIVDPRRRRLVLAAMCIALVAVVASVSGLNVAQQALATDLGATQTPGLTSVRTPIVDIGRAAGEQVIARLEGRPHVAFQSLPFELVVRGSTAPPPG